MNDPRIIVALDYSEAALVLNLVARLEPALCRLKVGKELFTSAGPQLVEQLMQRGFQVFLDLKFHDIPNTTAQACKAAAALGVWMVNVHALGGRKMMEAAREAVAQSTRPPKLIAVTVLTSMAQQDLAEIGVVETPADMVLRLALLARDSGLDGVVCSAQEAPMLRQRLQNGHGNYATPDDETRHARFPLPIPLPKGEGGRESLREFHVNEFCLVTPGIRPADASADDQSRIMTPRAALENGSSYLVIGRPITKAADPLLALQNIYKEIEGLE